VPLHAPYTASKWALWAFYDSLRMELAQEGAPIAVSTILPASIDTPFFEHARSKVGAMPKPPPPVCAPEVVADAIVFTAQHPRREGGGRRRRGRVRHRPAPVSRTDRRGDVDPRLGVSESKADRPDNGQDNVDAPMDGPGQVHGSYPGPVLRHSTVTAVLPRVPRFGDVLTGAPSTMRRAHGNGDGTVSSPPPARTGGH